MPFTTRHPSSSREMLWNEAWTALPLPYLAARLGDQWQQSGDPGPECRKKHKFKIFQFRHRWHFKCFNSECGFFAPEGAKEDWLPRRPAETQPARGCDRVSRLAVPHRRVLAQYSCLPVFLDEARRESLTDVKQAILRGAFGRQLPAKATADYTKKVRGVQPHTTPIVGGESSSHDAATRSRFGQVNVAANRRIGDSGQRKARTDADSEHYYRIADWLLTNRKKFAEAALYFLDIWSSSETVKRAIEADRPRFVHGVAFACMKAAAALLEIEEEAGQQFSPSPEAAAADPRPRTINAFQQWLLVHGAQAMSDVRDETFLSKFWDDIRQGVSRGKIPKKFFFTMQLTKKGDGWSMKRGGIENLPDGVTPALFIAIKDVFPAYEENYRQRTGQAPPLSMGDIRRTLEREAYWIPPEKHRNFHRPKAEKSGDRIDCWAISLVRHPSEAGSLEEPDFIPPFAEGLIAAIWTDDDNHS